MRLRGVDYGYCWDQSGVRNFFGEGYPYHKWFKVLGLDFTGSTFVAKTTTLRENKGNMPMRPDGVTPAEFLPKCIVVDYTHSVVLNAVGLSGPGANYLFRQGLWQQWPKPFAISFMSVTKTKAERLEEFRQFVNMYELSIVNPPKGNRFAFKPALQINFSCPNVKVSREFKALVDEVHETLEIGKDLGVAQIPKFNLLFPVEAAEEVSQNSLCDAICMGNSLPWGAFPGRVDWDSLFGSKGKSPLEYLGGGGLSGAPLLPLVAEWVEKATQTRSVKPIIAGGGILSPKDVNLLASAGASAIAVGAASILRPWAVKGIIQRAEYLGQQGKFFQPGVAEEVMSR